MINLSAVQTFSDQQILDVLRLSLVNSAIATQYTINGRVLARQTPNQIQELIREYEWRIARASGGLFAAAAMRRPE